MPIVRITKNLVQSSKPAPKETCYWDDLLRGFGLRVQPTGRKTFMVKGRDKEGNQYQEAIGDATLLEIDDARKEARLILIDRKVRLKSAPRICLSFEDLSVLYMRDYAIPHKRSWKADEQRLRDYLIPAFGKLPIDKISRSHFTAFHTSVGKGLWIKPSIDGIENKAMKAMPFLANRLREIACKMFDLAKLWNHIAEDAVNPATKITEFKEQKRSRYLQPEEVTKIDASLQAENNPVVKAIFRLLILTSLRKRELTTLKWSNVDLVNRRITLKSGQNGERILKNNEEHAIPLCAKAVSIFKSLPRRTDNQHCFVGLKVGKPFHQVDKAWQRIRKRAKLNDVRIHDLRRTGPSWMVQNQNTSLQVLGRLLNHKSESSTAIYAILAERNERDAVDKYGESMGPLLGD